MNDGKRQVTDETEPDENPIATIHYENGTELTGKAVTLQDGTVGVRIPGEFFKTALLPDGSMPDGVISVDIGPKHVEGGLPLTDDMVCMAVTAMLRDAVGLTSGEASDAYEAWLNRAKRATIEHWVDSLPALDDDTRTALIEAGRNVLAARANHPGQSLADLYDPDYMPTDLRAAHRELDKIADVAFGAGKWLKDDDDARLQVLFNSYTRMTGSSEV